MSYVAMGMKECPACGKTHSRGAEVLLHKRFRDIEDTVTGLNLCEEHYKEDFVCLIEASRELEGYHTTGSTMYLRADAAPHIFNKELTTDWAFVEPGVLGEIERLINKGQ